MSQFSALVRVLRPNRRGWFAVLIGMLAIFAADWAIAAEPASAGGRAVVRRLSPGQYMQIVRDVFGGDVTIGGRFEPDFRAGGLLAVGAGQVSVTATGFEQYYGMARTIAGQVVDPARRDVLIPCKPVSANAPDDACARQFLARTGRMLYRRPLTPAELESKVAVANEAAKSLKSFYAGLNVGLTNLLVSPMFLFRQESIENDPDNPGKYRLDAYAKASRLSFMLWNAAPDNQLLSAAESGELNTEKGLARQVDRLLKSRRLEAGVRAFFTDMLGFDQFPTVAKDAAIYPKFIGAVVEQAQEQTLRTIADQLLARKSDYRDLFTTRSTFLTPTLGIIYGMPVDADMAVGTPDPWVPAEVPDNGLNAGILTHASFVALYSHPGRTSPTLRGKALREVFLCQRVPDPPGNVSFTVVQDTTNPAYKTVRERLRAHASEAMCTGCHKITDPIGLALDTSDSAAGFRTNENGAKIDAGGELDGIKFANAADVGKILHDHPAVPSCLVGKLYSYGAGTVASQGQAAYMNYINERFRANGYRLPDLLRTIVTSKAFYQVDADQLASAAGVPTYSNP